MSRATSEPSNEKQSTEGAEPEETKVDDDSTASDAEVAQSVKEAKPSKTDKQLAKAERATAKRLAKRERPGVFASIALFFRQVIAELKKVVTPTRKELLNFTWVVLVFVIIMMALVTGLDLLFGWVASWVFGTGTEVQWPDFSQVFGGAPAATVDPTATVDPSATVDPAASAEPAATATP